MLKGIGIICVTIATSWVLFTWFVNYTFDGCPEGQVAIPLAGKGIYCVTATKWKSSALSAAERDT